MFVKPRQEALSRFGVTGIAVCVIAFGLAQIGSTVSAAPHRMDQTQANQNNATQDDRFSLSTTLQAQPLTVEGPQTIALNKSHTLATPTTSTPPTTTAPVTTIAPVANPSVAFATAVTLANQPAAHATRNDAPKGHHLGTATGGIANAVTGAVTTPTVPPTTVTTSAVPAATTQTHTSTPAPVTPTAPVGLAVATPMPATPMPAVIKPQPTPAAPSATGSAQVAPTTPTRTSGAMPGKPIAVQTRRHTLLTAKLAVGTGAGLLLIGLLTAIVVRIRRRESTDAPPDDFLHAKTSPVATSETAAAAIAGITTTAPIALPVETVIEPPVVDEIDLNDIDVNEIDNNRADDKVIDDLIAEVINTASAYVEPMLPLPSRSPVDTAEAASDIPLGKHHAGFDHSPVHFSFTVSPG